MPDPVQGKFIYWLLGAVAAGFLAWSFAVWRAVASVEVLANQVIKIEATLESHRERPWHNEAGHLIRLQATQLDRLEARQEEILELQREMRQGSGQ